MELIMTDYKEGDEVILHNLPSFLSKYGYKNKIGILKNHNSGNLEEFSYYIVVVDNSELVIHESEFIPATETNRILFCK